MKMTAMLVTLMTLCCRLNDDGIKTFVVEGWKRIFQTHSIPQCNQNSGFGINSRHVFEAVVFHLKSGFFWYSTKVARSMRRLWDIVQ